MTACSKWREELIDHALDQPASAALFTHLATCPGCTAALADWRANAAELDAGVRSLVAREPSSSFRSRVLAGIGTRPRPFTWAWQVRVVMAAALIGSVILVSYAGALKKHAQSTAIASAGAELSHWRAPSDVLLPNN